MPRNPCELQIDLFCQGLAVDSSCDLDADARGVSRTRAGLGSGLELIIEASRPVWVNAPTEERFVGHTPFLLQKRDGAYEILDHRDISAHSVRLPPEPAWYSRETLTGARMEEIGVLQGTYLGIYVGPVCRFWSDNRECRFCASGISVDPDIPRTVQAVVETALAAKAESGVTFVHLNTGYQRGAAYRLMAPFVEALKKHVGVLVGVQSSPEGTDDELDRLLELGVDHFSFCFEYFNKECFQRFCPGKQEALSQEAFFRALEYCQARRPKGACSGEIIAGNEPLESTLEAIDYITSIGSFPTVCVFRPLAGSDMEMWPPPSYESMRRVMKHMWERCRDRGIPIGLAPNVEVSLVVQPTDAAHLADGTFRDRWYMAKNRLLRGLAARHFKKRMARQ